MEDEELKLMADLRRKQLRYEFKNAQNQIMMMNTIGGGAVDKLK